jgi:hypothetical protein
MGILEAAPSPNGKFTVIKYKNWERYRPFYANYQHGSTKTSHLSTIMVPQYDEAGIDTTVPQEPVSVPPPSSTITSGEKINNTSPNREVQRLAADLFEDVEPLHVESKEGAIEGEVVR